MPGDGNGANYVRAVISASVMNAIPPFTGESEQQEPAITFIELLINMMKTNNWDQNTTLYVAQSRLRGAAAAWARGLKRFNEHQSHLIQSMTPILS